METLAAFLILLGLIYHIVKHARQSRRTWHLMMQPSTLKNYKISDDFEDPVVEAAVRNEIADLLEVCGENGFVFDYWYLLTRVDPALSLTGCQLRNTDQTISAYILVSYGTNPTSLQFSTDFPDNAKIITLCPWGETVDTPNFQFSFAYDPQFAFNHHQQQIEKMKVLHGEPLPLRTYEEDRESAARYHTLYESLIWQNLTRLYRTRFVTLRFAAIAMALLAALPILTLILFVRFYVLIVPLNDFFPVGYYYLGIVIGTGAWLYINWQTRRYTQFPDAADIHINPSPFSISAKKKKNTEPTGKHPLEDEETL